MFTHARRFWLAPGAALAFACPWLAPTLAAAERPPVFAGTVVFAGTSTKLVLPEGVATPVSLPQTFASWSCYVSDTDRSAGAYVRQVTCGGPWGLVDTFVSCDSKHRRQTASLRLRQPIEGTKAQVDAAEKVTITVGCSPGSGK
jgi:hypothetical protein